ncbi:RagB/SusD family nutrient uptake outer membrane protein [Pedobacter africanus]|uniref:SusD family protein n=1 Tax=Pedobacter africanus TaxID=151894 RepID=A0A1W1YNJ2_9SPHI|nr:RagB/SusD family nutrient uptake outer membrane protein [Pedobacter africanus]SMC37371.1 SusD family protein [Pedobacter africanus]
MMKISSINIFCFLLLFLILQSCKKEWLAAKPDKSLVVPETIKDYQSLLDNVGVFNTAQACGLGEVGAGDFYIADANWSAVNVNQEKGAYTWAKTEEFYNGELSQDWESAYRRVLNANVILNGIEKIKPQISEQQNWNNVKGSALFFRAFDFFNLAQGYCVNYNSASANQDLGLLLKLEYNINAKHKRSTLQQTYDQIIKDLETAANLLNTKSAVKTRPSKEAAYALLARTYLVMGNYEKAGQYANLTLLVQDDLLDYSKLNSAAAFPITRFNTEVIFHSLFYFGIFNPNRMTVTPGLYSEYVAGDCRKTIFFGPTGLNFKGSYNGDRSLFGGLTTGEMYLIRAEARARLGELMGALNDLNTLRRNRWIGIYADLNSADAATVLDYVIKERRRELPFRGIRWSDLRRLNTDSRFAVTLTRTNNGNTYTLPPNDKRYVLPIDEQEIRLSGIQQNER